MTKQEGQSLSDHVSQRAQLLTKILRHINDGNYERAGEGWSFGTGHGAPLVGRIGAMQNKDEVVLQKMRHLVYDQCCTHCRH